MPRRRRTAARALTMRQEEELLFNWGGQCTHDIGRGSCHGIGCWSQFETEEEREEAWLTHRERLLHLLNPGIRPPAFWYYDAPLLCTHRPRCPVPALSAPDTEKLAWLRRHDQLAPREIAALRRMEKLQEIGG